MGSTPLFLCGVIEGFYGRPWQPAQRDRLLGWMQDGAMNTYLYAPKDDIKHRALWREPYDETELAALRQIVTGCQERGIDFAYALAPGLDLNYRAELPIVHAKLRQVAALGVRTFALLFDDIPQVMRDEDQRHFGSFAAAQVRICNDLLHCLRAESAEATLWFCPTVYCARFAAHRVSTDTYLREIGASLDPTIEVMWTGPEVVSETIPVDSIREIAAVLQRKPLIWDNLHANDYDLRRIYLGPFSGRPLALREEVRGVLSNPNCEFEANFIPLHTLAAYARASMEWDERRALQAACEAWLPQFGSRARQRFESSDIQLLVDLFYLPFGDGARADESVADYAFLLQHPVADWGTHLARFEKTCADVVALHLKMTELADRELCFTFLRHLVEVCLETIVMRGYVDWLKSPPVSGTSYAPGGDLGPKKYRGGLVARLQRLLLTDDRGTFSAARHDFP